MTNLLSSFASLLAHFLSVALMMILTLMTSEASTPTIEINEMEDLHYFLAFALFFFCVDLLYFSGM
jgi:hypothetical protein